MRRFQLCCFLCSLFLVPTCCGHNISDVLNDKPECSEFLSLLEKYGIANQINTRSPVTVLCPPNVAMQATMEILGAPQVDPMLPFSMLSYHVLLDYFDMLKLKSLTGGGDNSAVVTTLYQTTGLATNNSGSVSIMNVRGTPKLGLPQLGSPLVANVTKPIAADPYNMSVLAIDATLVPAGLYLLLNSSLMNVNISRAIAQGGDNYSIFLELAQKTGLNEILETSPPGLTLFVPTNAAFQAISLKLSALNDTQILDVMRFHGVASFYPEESLVRLIGSRLETLAGIPYTLNFVSEAGIPVIDNGVDPVYLRRTLYNLNPIVIYSIDTVLLPKGFNQTSSPSPSPSPSHSSSHSPSPVSETPDQLPSLAPSLTPSIIEPLNPTASLEPPAMATTTSPPAPPPSPVGAFAPRPDLDETALSSPSLLTGSFCFAVFLASQVLLVTHLLSFPSL